MQRSEIDRRLAEGEPTAQVARAFGLSTSSLHRHRTNCARLGSSNTIKKEQARGTAALALLPSKETLDGAYTDLRDQIDQIVTQAQAEGSLAIALKGLTSLRQTLDSQARLAGHTQAGGTQVNVGVQINVNAALIRLVERVNQRFDDRPEIKAELAQIFVEVDNEQSA